MTQKTILNETKKQIYLLILTFNYCDLVLRINTLAINNNKQRKI